MSSRKRSSITAAHYIENEDEAWWSTEGYGYTEPDYHATQEAEDTPFQDVELFLTEHGKDGGESSAVEGFPEEEVAEILATTWKDRRQELARLKRARRFHQADDVRRSFRVEVEELKKRTQCRRCRKTGHWARECRAKMPAGSGSNMASSSSGPPTSAGLVQFVCHAVLDMQGGAMTMVEKLRAKRRVPTSEMLLVSSPGFAVLDSGCGCSVIGKDTLEEFRRFWQAAGVHQPVENPETNVFRFGNGAQEMATSVVDMPVCLAGKAGIIKAAIIQGKAPLMSRPALKTLSAKMDFTKDELCLFESGESVPLQINEAGQYIVPVAQFPKKSAGEAAEVMIVGSEGEQPGVEDTVDEWQASSSYSRSSSAQV